MTSAPGETEYCTPLFVATKPAPDGTGSSISRKLFVSSTADGLRTVIDTLPLALWVRLTGTRALRVELAHAGVSSAAVDLVVLSDYLVADPRMVRDLHSRGVAHLPVRVRDSTGLVGPLVIPGVTSCLDNS
jgi:hypothetical protein